MTRGKFYNQHYKVYFNHTCNLVSSCKQEHISGVTSYSQAHTSEVASRHRKYLKTFTGTLVLADQFYLM